MANMVFVNSDTLEDIADAIRAKKSVSTHYKPSEMAAAIESINTGGGVTLVSKTITENGTYDPSDDNADGYSEAIVNVPGPTLVNKVITTNGTYDPADDNADVEVYDADGNQWEIYNTQNLVDEKLFRINLY